MRLGRIHGVIDRRLLVNYRADPHVVAKLLPKRFRPQVVNNKAMVGICLIRFSALRPYGIPAILGLNSENAAHRIAVEWDSPEGVQAGVFIHRRDTSLWLNTLIGGRLFPGVHHRADFSVQESRENFSVAFKSRYDGMEVRVRGRPVTDLPKTSIFSSVQKSSEFFKAGSVGYSPGFKTGEYQGLQLITEQWKVEPFEVEDVHSTFFTDSALFPPGSVEFDHALLMRDLLHSWRVVQ